MDRFTPRPLYLQGKSHRYALDRGLGEPQSRSGRGGEDIPSLPLLELNPGRPGRNLVTILTELP
jgi:hypothetical protein